MEAHQIRLKNLLTLQNDFISARRKESRNDLLVVPDEEFAVVMEMGKATFSLYKTGARPMGERIANQICNHLGKPKGWMDIEYSAPAPSNEERELQRFLKLAKRAFKRADESQRKKMAEFLHEQLR